MAGPEFELADEGCIIDGPRSALACILRSQLLFEGKDPKEHEELTQDSVERGIALSRSIARVSAQPEPAGGSELKRPPGGRRRCMGRTGL